MDTKTSVAETKAFTLEAENTAPLPPKKRETKRKGEKIKFRDTKTKWNKKTKTSFTAK
jgi:hypothetical protein